MHPSDQLLAYEWNFGNVNPPGHAWATFALYFTEMQLRDQGDVLWLKHSFQKLLMDFTWWSTARAWASVTCSKAASSAPTTSAR